MPKIPIEVDGQIYTLEMSIDAMETLEELFSTPEKEVTFFEILTKVVQGRPKYFKRFIWAALQKHHPDMDLPAAANFIDAAGGMYALDALLGKLQLQVTPDPLDLAALGVKERDGTSAKPMEANPPKAQAGKRHGARSKSKRAA